MFDKSTAKAPPDPRQSALVGRRDSKEPGSPEWIMQTLQLASLRLASFEHSVESWTEVLAELEAFKVWERFPPEKPYGTREALFLKEFGKPEPELTAAKVKQQKLRGEAGRPKRGEEYGDNITIFERGTQPSYVRARLERDGHTELLAKIERGETTAHAVAVELGWRARRIQIVPTVQGLARAAQAHLSPEQRLELKELL